MIQLPDVPYEFTGPYEPCYRLRENCVDERHVYTIHDVLLAVPFQSALEIGCADGASSTAFVEAMNRRNTLRATFCDLVVTGNLQQVVNNTADKSRAHIVAGSSTQVLWNPAEFGGPFDFIFVDGSHDFDSVAAELDAIREFKPLAIMAHDTGGMHYGNPACEGAAFLKRVIAMEWGWYTLEDDLRRDGEETHRGLFFATPSAGVFRRAKSVFRKWCLDEVGVTV